MAKYRKVDPYIWNDSRFSNFTDDGKLAFLFILTHPNMTSLGAMRATMAGIAGELGWAPERVSESLSKSLSERMIIYNEKACFLRLTKFLTYNPPENPNVILSWRTAIYYIPECDEKIELIQYAMECSEGYGEAFAKAFHKAFGKGLAKQRAKSKEQRNKPILTKVSTTEVSSTTVGGEV